MKYLLTSTTAFVVDTETRMFRAMDLMHARRQNRQDPLKVLVAYGPVENRYAAEKDPVPIPVGTVIRVDFACDAGMYGMADIGGVLIKVLVPLNLLHLLHYPGIDD